MFAHRIALLALLGGLAWPAAGTVVTTNPGIDRGAPPAITVMGTVTDAGTGAPLEAVQISVVGERMGALTDSTGAYTLTFGDAWAGRGVNLEVKHLGYRIEGRAVRLTQTTITVDFRLEQEAIALDAISVSPSRAEVQFRTAIFAPASRALMEGESRRLVGRYDPDFNTESYGFIEENVFLAAATNPLSTFSIDVDRASYANVRRFINEGRRPPVDAVRIEELINYFPYDDPIPTGDHPLSVRAELAPAPWQPLHRLVRIGLKGRPVDMSEAPPSNLVFLLDVSGSMRSPDKLPLLKTAFGMLVDQLRPEDRVAIVVYAGSAGLVLPSTPGNDREAILEAIEGLQAGGSTAGGAGIHLAYKVAAENHIRGGNNRVILATDGDFNVGASSDSEMIRLIEDKRDQGTFLTVLGFGTGNLKDSKMEQIADKGNGNFAYIDNALEAKKVLVSEMGGTLLTIAKDVKLQVEFNPNRVAGYRLIGYENRLLAAEDFADDTKDAGELGAGHSVTALYEVIPAGVDSPVEIRVADSLRYQTTVSQPRAGDSEELLFVKLRYKEPDQDTSQLLEFPVRDNTARASRDFRFASSVAAWGMLLRGSEYCSDFTLREVAELARGALGPDPEGYRSEFLRLVEATDAMDLLEKEAGER